MSKQASEHANKQTNRPIKHTERKRPFAMLNVASSVVVVVAVAIATSILKAHTHTYFGHWH